MRYLTVAAALSLLVSAVPVYAAPHGIFWAKGAQPPRSAEGGSGGLLYYGGPVIPNAKVVVVLWGDNAVDAAAKEQLGPFFANMLDSTYMDWLAEYDTNLTAVDGRAGTAQHIGRGRYAGLVTLHPNNAATALQDADVQKELEAQIAAGVLPRPDENTLYMTYFPAGISITIDNQRSCTTFCAYHEGFHSARLSHNVFYGVMPACAASCAYGSTPFDSLSIVSSHEAIEAVTDPFPTPGNSPAFPQAWNASDGNEIGDLCADGAATVTGHGIVSQVQYEWDNKTMACNHGPWTQAIRARPFESRLKASPEQLFKGF